jgi:hypothetical protein
MTRMERLVMKTYRIVWESTFHLKSFCISDRITHPEHKELAKWNNAGI